MEGGLEAGAQSSKRERLSLGGASAGAVRVQTLRVQAPLRSDALSEPLGRKKDAPGLVQVGRTGFSRATSRYWLNCQDSPQSNRSLPFLPTPPHCISPACSRGGGTQRLLVTLATVSGPCLPGNSPRPPVSLRLGPSGHPDNHDPFRSTISPFPVTLATVTRPIAPPDTPSSSCKQASPQTEVSGSLLLSPIFPALERVLLPLWLGVRMGRARGTV